MVNPTSIPEHSEFTKELDKHITEIATAKEKIAVLENDLAYLKKDHLAYLGKDH
jgi:2-phospho-L-lactate guanylyltransferase (CobY/MobA/RfbA family)